MRVAMYGAIAIESCIELALCDVRELNGFAACTPMIKLNFVASKYGDARMTVKKSLQRWP